MNYSPRLKEAMRQIKQILDDNDIAGVVALHTPGFGEHLVKIDPTYSAAKIEHQPDGNQAIRVKIKTEDVGKEKAKALATDTTNMFHVLTNMMGPQVMTLIEMDEFMEKNYKPDHFGPGPSSHTTQNN